MSNDALLGGAEGKTEMGMSGQYWLENGHIGVSLGQYVYSSTDPRSAPDLESVNGSRAHPGAITGVVHFYGSSDIEIVWTNGQGRVSKASFSKK